MANADDITRKWQDTAAGQAAPAEGDAPDAADNAARFITFYCPNGHRIKVEARLAGKRGPCSKCGAVVTIPEVSSPRRPPGGVKVGETATAGDEQTGFNFLKPAEAEPAAESMPAVEPELPGIVVDAPVVGEAEGGEQAGEELGEQQAIADYVEPPPGDGTWHPTADLVARLWAERHHGGVVEVHCTGGVFVPEWYDVAWSRGTHGVFAKQDADGTVVLTAVAWDSVQKVIVRRVEGLPAGMFE